MQSVWAAHARACSPTAVRTPTVCLLFFLAAAKPPRFFSLTFRKIGRNRDYALKHGRSAFVLLWNKRDDDMREEKCERSRADDVKKTRRVARGQGQSIAPAPAAGWAAAGTPHAAVPRCGSGFTPRTCARASSRARSYMRGATPPDAEELERARSAPKKGSAGGDVLNVQPRGVPDSLVAGRCEAEAILRREGGGARRRARTRA